MKESKYIVFFDGVCNLCNSSVDFILKHKSADNFRFCSLQSDYAINNLKLSSKNEFDSIILLKNTSQYNKSNAALHIAKELKFPYNLLYIFIIIPQPIRDLFYSFIAKNRYKWFGKTETCRIPTLEEKSFFYE